ncbi:ATP-binding cassette domain-containing protein [Azospirillum formosense]|uniref:ATP-binding cassette domain-containing protein n=1 Tax=Azospirillum formosense TaxID=861533 RepID=A0ABX2L4T4_9PROT|nr:ABC transporter ATP-binding protein [Azospirillum formosense]MBY3756366.1 ABC transporter ATP-binding protein [Azospirillum formosense]NUB20788.1 ATP-binding cassette domain-containing protein [Azospirillum formosense]
MPTPLLRVRDLRTSFGSGDRRTEVVKGVSFDLNRGEVLGLIGESGSGKTVTGLSVLQLLPDNAHVEAAELTYDGRSLAALGAKEMQGLRGAGLAMIFQDPVGSFNPAKTIGWHLVKALGRHSAGSPGALKEVAADLLKQVNIREPERTMASYPHQLSGGMLQRVLIAMVFGLNPRLVIADEPTTNLDNLVERQILELIRSQQRQHDTGVLFVTHDLTVARHLCDRVAVMYSGRIVEIGPTERILERPAHPYTAGLLATARSLEKRDATLYEIKGEPGASSWAKRCAFSARCPQATDRCTAAEPTEHMVESGHSVRCFNHAA